MPGTSRGSEPTSRTDAREHGRRNTSGSAISVHRDVHVVLVVGRAGAAVRHRAPALAAALDGPDVLGVDDFADAKLTGVGADPASDLPPDLRVRDHAVDGLAARVEPAAPAQPAEGGHLGVAGA